MVAPYTAGSPIEAFKWLRGSLSTFKQMLSQFKIKLSVPTLSRLLKAKGYRLRVNHKKHEAGSNHPQRDLQFKQIERLRRQFYLEGWPVISVDTKKKELIGNFKNAGTSWGKQAHQVNAHDFLSEALGRAVPYGIYDLRYGRGSVYVGNSADTPEFAVAAIVRWWEEEGRYRYGGAQHLLILADSGGSNSCHARLWKQQLYQTLARPYDLQVTVAHYPTGCSKWNPIEHKLFSAISLNWAGQPLTSFDKMLGYIRGTTNQKGLTVRAKLLSGVFECGKKVTQKELEQLPLSRAEDCPQWTYTLHPGPPLTA